MLNLLSESDIYSDTFSPMFIIFLYANVQISSIVIIFSSVILSSAVSNLMLHYIDVHLYFLFSSWFLSLRYCLLPCFLTSDWISDIMTLKYCKASYHISNVIFYIWEKPIFRFTVQIDQWLIILIQPDYDKLKGVKF